MLKKRTPDSRRRMTGWLLSALTALLLTSEPVRDFTALPDSIRLTRGSGAGIYEGQYYQVFNPGRQIVHPKTGRVLGTAESFAATIQVTQVTPDLSIAVICDTPTEQINPGAYCRNTEPSASGTRYGIPQEAPPPPPAYPMAN